jgi:hypothetical protein
MVECVEYSCMAGYEIEYSYYDNIHRCENCSKGFELKELGENKLGCRLNFTCKKDGSSKGEFDGVWDRPIGL